MGGCGAEVGAGAPETGVGAVGGGVTVGLEVCKCACVGRPGALMHKGKGSGSSSAAVGVDVMALL